MNIELYDLNIKANKNFKCAGPLKGLIWGYHHHEGFCNIEQFKEAYLSGLFLSIAFGTSFHYVKQNKKWNEYFVNYNNPYGKFIIEADNGPRKKKPKGTKKQTYCTVLVSALVRRFTLATKITYMEARKKHPIHKLLQSSANTCCRFFAAGEMNCEGYRFEIVDKATATEYAKSGGLVIMSWENPKRDKNNNQYAGHVSVLVAENLCYNAGAKYGFMKIKKAFGFDNENIKYNILLDTSLKEEEER